MSQAQKYTSELCETWTEGLLEDAEEQFQDKNEIFDQNLHYGALLNFRKYNNYEPILNEVYQNLWSKKQAYDIGEGLEH